MTQPTHTPSALRTVVLCAAFALTGGLAQAQTTQPASNLGANGQSTAPHTTNSQSAVSDQRATMGPAGTATGSTTPAAHGKKKQSNVPHATPGMKDTTGTAGAAGTQNSTGGSAHAAASGGKKSSNVPHATPGMKDTTGTAGAAGTTQTNK